MSELQTHAADYNGFNLLVGDGRELGYLSNYDGQPRRVEPGYHGLSNHLLNTPWPKLERGRERLRELLDAPSDPSDETLLDLLADRTPAADDELPHTGVSLEWERKLSSIFIEAPGYGTRTSTILRLYPDDRLSLVEKNWSDGTQRAFTMQWP